MQQQEVPGKPFQEDADGSSWSPPAPPRLGMRARSVLFFERYGFELLCALLLVVIAYLYINADRLAAAVQTTISEAGEPPAGAVSVSPEVADSPAALSLSIATSPAGASIFIDNAFVGISPLRSITIREGPRRVTVQKPDYTPLDTIITFADPETSLQINMRAGQTPSLAVAGAPVPAPTGSDQPVQDDTPRVAVRHAEAPARASEAVVQRPPTSPGAGRLPEATPADVVDPPPVVPEKETAGRVKASVKEPRRQVGELEIHSTPAGASVAIDGTGVGVTPLVLSEVEAGARAVTMQLEGYETFTATVTVAPQQRQAVNGTLAPRFGILKILARPWGTIYIDGALQKSETDIWYTTKLTPGFHRVRVEHATLGRWEQVVDIVAGEELPVTIDFN